MSFLKKSRVFPLILAAIFFVTNTFAGTPLSANPVEVFPAESVKALNLQVSPDFGKVTEVVSAKNNAPVLIHIQTAHGHYQAQKNIQAILNQLQQTYGINLLLLEGAGNKLSPETFRLFPEDNDLNNKIIEAFMKEGQFTGAEAFLVQAPDSTQGWGVEDLELYRKNREEFRHVIQQSSAADQFLKECYKQWEILATRTLNKDLRHFLRQKSSHENQILPLASWLQVLKDKSDKNLSLNFEDIRNQVEWPMLVRYFRLDKISKKIDFSKAESQKRQFFLDVASRKIDPSLIQSLHQILETSKHALSSYVKVRPIFEQLMERLPANYSFEAYPDLRILIQHLILTSELLSEPFRREITTLEERIAQKLAKTEKDKELLSLLAQYQWFKKGFELEWTREDFEKVQTKKLKPSQLFEQMGKTHGVGIDELYQKVFIFYQDAVEREKIMMKHAVDRLRKNSQERAVLITGGFHAEGVKQAAAQSNISYVQITPRIDEITPESREIYLKVLLGSEAVNKSQIEALLRSDIQAMQQEPDFATIRSELHRMASQVIQQERQRQPNKKLSMNRSEVRETISESGGGDVSGGLDKRKPNQLFPISTELLKFPFYLSPWLLLGYRAIANQVNINIVTTNNFIIRQQKNYDSKNINSRSEMRSELRSHNGKIITGSQPENTTARFFVEAKRIERMLDELLKELQQSQAVKNLDMRWEIAQGEMKYLTSLQEPNNPEQDKEINRFEQKVKNIREALSSRSEMRTVQTLDRHAFQQTISRVETALDKVGFSPNLSAEARSKISTIHGKLEFIKKMKSRQMAYLQLRAILDLLKSDKQFSSVQSVLRSILKIKEERRNYPSSRVKREEGETPILASHRGFSPDQKLKENTIPAFDQAILEGAEMLQVDLRQLSNGQWVLWHDAFVQIRNGRKLLIKKSDLRTLQKYNPQVLTLEAVLDYAREKDISLNLEIKEINDHQSGLQSLMRWIREKKIESQVFISSYNLGYLRAIREWRISFPIGWVVNLRRHSKEYYQEKIGDLKPEYLIFDYEQVNERLIRQFKRKGIQIGIWNVNGRQAVLDDVLNWNADLIIANRVGVARNALHSARRIARSEVRKEIIKEGVKKLWKLEDLNQREKVEKGEYAGLRREFQFQKFVRLWQYQPQFLSGLLSIPLLFQAGIEYIKRQLLDQNLFSFFASLFKPISRNQNDSVALFTIDNLQNLTTELFLRQMPSSKTSLGMVGMGYGAFNLFRGQFSLVNSSSNMGSIYKNHNKYDNYRITNVKDFVRVRSEMRSEERPLDFDLDSKIDLTDYKNSVIWAHVLATYFFSVFASKYGKEELNNTEKTLAYLQRLEALQKQMQKEEGIPAINFGIFSDWNDKMQAMSYFIFGETLAEDEMIKRMDAQPRQAVYALGNADLIFGSIYEMGREGREFLFRELVQRHKRDMRRVQEILNNLSVINPKTKEPEPLESFQDTIEINTDEDFDLLKRGVNIVLDRIPARSEMRETKRDSKINGQMMMTITINNEVMQVPTSGIIGDQPVNFRQLFNWLIQHEKLSGYETGREVEREKIIIKRKNRGGKETIRRFESPSPTESLRGDLPLGPFASVQDGDVIVITKQSRELKNRAFSDKQLLQKEKKYRKFVRQLERFAKRDPRFASILQQDRDLELSKALRYFAAIKQEYEARGYDVKKMADPVTAYADRRVWQDLYNNLAQRALVMTLPGKKIADIEEMIPLLQEDAPIYFSLHYLTNILHRAGVTEKEEIKAYSQQIKEENSSRSASDPDGPKVRGEVRQPQEGKSQVIPLTVRPYDWTREFGNDKPIIVEIGFGWNGEILRNQAKKYRDKFNFVGIELPKQTDKDFIKSLSRYPNVRVVYAWAERVIPAMFADHSIHKLHVFFPFPDAGISLMADLVSDLKRKLAFDGEIVFVTESVKTLEEVKKVFQSPEFSMQDHGYNLNEKSISGMLGIPVRLSIVYKHYIKSPFYYARIRRTPESNSLFSAKKIIKRITSSEQNRSEIRSLEILDKKSMYDLRLDDLQVLVEEGERLEPLSYGSIKEWHFKTSAKDYYLVVQSGGTKIEISRQGDRAVAFLRGNYKEANQQLFDQIVKKITRDNGQFRSELRNKDMDRELLKVRLRDEFGVVLEEDGLVDQAALPEKEWMMTKTLEGQRPLKPVVENLDDHTVLKLVYPFEILPRFQQQGGNSEGIYLGFAEGIAHPIAMKMFKLNQVDPLELINAQIMSLLGLGPEFYGIVRLENGHIGYGLQVVPGKEINWDGMEKVPRFFYEKALEAGLWPMDFVKTPSGNLVSIDAGNHDVVEYKDYKKFIEDSRSASSRSELRNKKELKNGRERISAEDVVTAIYYDSDIRKHSYKFTIPELKDKGFTTAMQHISKAVEKGYVSLIGDQLGSNGKGRTYVYQLTAAGKQKASPRKKISLSSLHQPYTPEGAEKFIGMILSRQPHIIPQQFTLADLRNALDFESNRISHYLAQSISWPRDYIRIVSERSHERSRFYEITEKGKEKVVLDRSELRSNSSLSRPALTSEQIEWLANHGFTELALQELSLITPEDVNASGYQKIWKRMTASGVIPSEHTVKSKRAETKVFIADHRYAQAQSLYRKLVIYENLYRLFNQKASLPTPSAAHELANFRRMLKSKKEQESPVLIQGSQQEKMKELRRLLREQLASNKIDSVEWPDLYIRSLLTDTTSRISLSFTHPYLFNDHFDLIGGKKELKEAGKLRVEFKRIFDSELLYPLYEVTPKNPQYPRRIFYLKRDAQLTPVVNERPVAMLLDRRLAILESDWEFKTPFLARQMDADDIHQPGFVNFETLYRANEKGNITFKSKLPILFRLNFPANSIFKMSRIWKPELGESGDYLFSFVLLDENGHVVFNKNGNPEIRLYRLKKQLNRITPIPLDLDGADEERVRQVLFDHVQYELTPETDKSPSSFSGLYLRATEHGTKNYMIPSASEENASLRLLFRLGTPKGLFMMSRFFDPNLKEWIYATVEVNKDKRPMAGTGRYFKIRRSGEGKARYSFKESVYYPNVFVQLDDYQPQSSVDLSWVLPVIRMSQKKSVYEEWEIWKYNPVTQKIKTVMIIQKRGERIILQYPQKVGYKAYSVSAPSDFETKLKPLTEGHFQFLATKKNDRGEIDITIALPQEGDHKRERKDFSLWSQREIQETINHWQNPEEIGQKITNTLNKAYRLSMNGISPDIMISLPTRSELRSEIWRVSVQLADGILPLLGDLPFRESLLVRKMLEGSSLISPPGDVLIMSPELIRNGGLILAAVIPNQQPVIALAPDQVTRRLVQEFDSSALNGSGKILLAANENEIIEKLDEIKKAHRAFAPALKVRGLVAPDEEAGLGALLKKQLWDIQVVPFASLQAVIEGAGLIDQLAAFQAHYQLIIQSA